MNFFKKNNELLKEKGFSKGEGNDLKKYQPLCHHAFDI